MLLRRPWFISLRLTGKGERVYTGFWGPKRGNAMGEGCGGDGGDCGRFAPGVRVEMTMGIGAVMMTEVGGIIGTVPIRAEAGIGAEMRAGEEMAMGVEMGELEFCVVL